MDNKKGITLISLVITIVVLLIIAGVAIKLAVDSDGLFGKAGDAANKWNTSVAEEETKLNDSINQLDNYGTINWEKIIADATANLDKYRHEQQKDTNGDIGIGTDGKPVNLDLWNYEVVNTNEIHLGLGSGSMPVPGYSNANINKNTGEIQGTIPQYIKLEEEDEFYAVTDLRGTFYGCYDLIVAPQIPTTTKIMGRKCRIFRYIC